MQRDHFVTIPIVRYLNIKRRIARENPSSKLNKLHQQ